MHSVPDVTIKQSNFPILSDKQQTGYCRTTFHTKTSLKLSFSLTLLSCGSSDGDDMRIGLADLNYKLRSGSRNILQVMRCTQGMD